jgi:hypothetical protein
VYFVVASGSRELIRLSAAAIELPQGQLPGVKGEWAVRHLDLDGQRLVEIEVEQPCNADDSRASPSYFPAAARRLLP